MKDQIVDYAMTNIQNISFAIILVSVPSELKNKGC